MKTILKNSLIAASALVAGLALAKSPHGDPYNPIGTLDVNQSMVRSGVNPEITWDIMYPENVTDVVTVGPRRNLTIRKRLRMEVRVVGVAFQSGATELPVGFWARIGGSGAPWKALFFGDSDAVKAKEPVFDEILEAGTEIDFAGRGRTATGGWYSTRWTLDDLPTVAALVNGDSVPDYAPAYAQGDIESFLTPYIGKNNNGHGNNLDGIDSVKKDGTLHDNKDADPSVTTETLADGTYDDEAKLMTLGPKDMIYLFELYATTPDTSYFDLQDLAVVITFHEVE